MSSSKGWLSVRHLQYIVGRGVHFGISALPGIKTKVGKIAEILGLNPRCLF